MALNFHRSVKLNDHKSYHRHSHQDIQNNLDMNDTNYTNMTVKLRMKVIMI